MPTHFTQHLFSSNWNQKSDLLASVLDYKRNLLTRLCFLVIRSAVPSCGEERSLEPDADSRWPSCPDLSLSSTVLPCWREPMKSGSNGQGHRCNTKELNTQPWTRYIRKKHSVVQKHSMVRSFIIFHGPTGLVDDNTEVTTVLFILSSNNICLTRVF